MPGTSLFFVITGIHEAMPLTHSYSKHPFISSLKNVCWNMSVSYHSNHKTNNYSNYLQLKSSLIHHFFPPTFLNIQEKNVQLEWLKNAAAFASPNESLYHRSFSSMPGFCLSYPPHVFSRSWVKNNQSLHCAYILISPQKSSSQLTQSFSWEQEPHCFV